MGFDVEIIRFLTSSGLIAFNRQQGARERAFYRETLAQEFGRRLCGAVPVEECQVPPKIRPPY